MTAATCLLVLLSFACFIKAQELPDGYEDLPAKDKSDILWNLLSSDPTPAEWPSALATFKMLAWDLSLAFTDPSDYRPYKKRVVHVEGAVAKFRFTPKESSYKGMFGSESIGIVRMSTASKPSTGGWFSSSSVIPATAIKFFLDGKPSLNVAAMYLMTGHSGLNVFQHGLSNHVPTYDLNLALKIIQVAFEKVSKYASLTGLSDMATTDPQGNVDKNAPTPFAFIVQPNPYFTDALQANEDGDVMGAISRIPAKGKTLYRVFLVSSPLFPESGSIDHVGDMVLTSDFTTSAWGDAHLAFQQQLFDDDLVVNPDWVDIVTEEYMENEGLDKKYEQYLPPW